MGARRTKPESPAVRPLVLPCRPLPAFNPMHLDGVRSAFQSVDPCALRQTWQAEPSPQFAPALVRAGWNRNALLVYAELLDADIQTQASGVNQRLWELGDAFEIFLRPEGQEAYVEFQVSPNNQRLQLRYENAAALERARRTGSCAPALIPGEAFWSKVWIEDNPSRWHVFAEIPAAVVCGSGDALGGARWRFSFSRYDYTRGLDEPVISSTSPHAEANFHRQQEWGVLHFENHHRAAGD
jgi:hypothetical protein